MQLATHPVWLNMWDHLKKTAQEKNPKKLWRTMPSVHDGWNEFPGKRLLNLIHSTPSRCKAVFKARGGLIIY